MSEMKYQYLLTIKRKIIIITVSIDSRVLNCKHVFSSSTSTFSINSKMRLIYTQLRVPVSTLRPSKVLYHQLVCEYFK